MADLVKVRAADFVDDPLQYLADAAAGMVLHVQGWDAVVMSKERWDRIVAAMQDIEEGRSP